MAALLYKQNTVSLPKDKASGSNSFKLRFKQNNLLSPLRVADASALPPASPASIGILLVSFIFAPFVWYFSWNIFAAL